MSRLVLSSIRSQRSAVPNYRGGCDEQTMNCGPLDFGNTRYVLPVMTAKAMLSSSGNSAAELKQSDSAPCMRSVD